MRDDRPPLFDQANKYPLLTATQERELAKRIERGDMRAKETFINSNIRLVIWQAGKYQQKDVPFEDVVQEGMLGLIRAVEMFDWRRNIKFSTYAINWVRQAIMRGLDNKRHAVRVPVGDMVFHRALREEIQVFQKKHERSPTDDEVMKIGVRIGIKGLVGKPDVERIKDIERATGNYISLNKGVGDEGEVELGDLLPGSTPNPESTVIHDDLRAFVRKQVGKLPEEERTILTLHYGLMDDCEMSYNEIGRTLGMSSEKVAKIEKTARQKLRFNEDLASVSTEEAWSKVTWFGSKTHLTDSDRKRTLCGRELPTDVQSTDDGSECDRCFNLGGVGWKPRRHA